MTEWRTVNIRKKFKDELEEYAEENGFDGAKAFLVHVAKKEMEKENTEQIVRRILKEEDVI